MRYANTIYLLILVTVLTGCSSLKFHNVDRGALYQQDLTKLTMENDARVLIIKQKMGFPFGGMLWGLYAENPEIAQIEYEEKGRTQKTYIYGRSPGTTTVYFINRHGVNPNNPDLEIPEEKMEYIKENSGRFILTVQ